MNASREAWPPAPGELRDTHPPPLTPSMPGREAKLQMLLGDIHVKWGKFSDADLAELESRDDVVTKVMARYGRDREFAECEVDALFEDRARRRPRQMPLG